MPGVQYCLCAGGTVLFVYRGYSTVCVPGAQWYSDVFVCQEYSNVFVCRGVQYCLCAGVTVLFVCRGVQYYVCVAVQTAADPR